jgi:flagellar biogenesis protein FliO
MNSASQVEQIQPVSGKLRPFPPAGDWRQSLLIKTWSGLKWVIRRAKAQQARKNLRVCESVSLGEKRFVAIIQVDEEKFLIGGSSSAVSLLTRLQETKSLASAFDREAAEIS